MLGELFGCLWRHAVYCTHQPGSRWQKLMNPNEIWILFNEFITNGYSILLRFTIINSNNKMNAAQQYSPGPCILELVAVNINLIKASCMVLWSLRIKNKGGGLFYCMRWQLGIWHELKRTAQRTYIDCQLPVPSFQAHHSVARTQANVCGFQYLMWTHVFDKHCEEYSFKV